MTDNEEKFVRIARHLFLTGEIDEAKQTLIYGLKICPNNIVMQNLLVQYQDIKNLNELDDNRQTIIKDNVEIKQNNNGKSITRNSKFLRDRLGLLTKELIQIDYDTLMERIHDIETHLDNAYIAVFMNNLEKAEHYTTLAETSNADFMNTIKEVGDKSVKRTKEYIKHKDNIEVFDYKSTLTVRGTVEDVINCIIEAKTAFENGKNDRAEELLLRAERILPTQNARYLLKQVRAAMEPKKNPEPIEHFFEHIVKDEKAISEDGNVNAGRCLTAFKQALISGNLEKAKRMLNKAKRFNPSLDIEKELSHLKATITNKEENEKAKQDWKTTGESLYISTKAYDAFSLLNTKQVKYLQHSEPLTPKITIADELNTNKTFEVQKDSIINKYTSKIDADYKPNEFPKKNKQASNFTSKMHKEKLKYATNILNMEKELYSIPFLSSEETDMHLERERKKFEEEGKPKTRNTDGLKKNTEKELLGTARLNEKLSISEIHSIEETYVPSNCYEFPVKDNESNELASNCIQYAREAFKANQYDKFEHFLNRLQRIYDNQEARMNSNTVRSSKAQNNIKVSKNNNKYEQDYFLMAKASAESNTTKNVVSKQHKPNKYVRASQPVRDQVTSRTTHTSRTRRGSEMV